MGNVRSLPGGLWTLSAARYFSARIGGESELALILGIVYLGVDDFEYEREFVNIFCLCL